MLSPKDLLFEEHTAHTICDGGRRAILEVYNIFVTSRLVDSGESVQSKIEGLTVLNDGLVKRRQEHITLIITLSDWADHKSVVLSRVATNDGGTHITTRSVGREHLALKRVFEVAQTVLVECKYCHISLLIRVCLVIDLGFIEF